MKIPLAGSRCLHLWYCVIARRTPSWVLMTSHSSSRGNLTSRLRPAAAVAARFRSMHRRGAVVGVGGQRPTHLRNRPVSWTISALKG